jgi:hypothetical protein
MCLLIILLEGFMKDKNKSRKSSSSSSSSSGRKEEVSSKDLRKVSGGKADSDFKREEKKRSQ